MVSNCLVILVLVFIGPAPFLQSCDIVGIEFERLIQILDCAVIVMLLEVREPPAIKGIRIVRIQTRGLVKIFNGVVVFFLMVVSKAAVVKGGGKLVVGELTRLYGRRAVIDGEIKIVFLNRCGAVLGIFK